MGVADWPPVSLSAEGGSVGWVGGAPLQCLSSSGWSCLGASGAAFRGLALIGCAGSWFSAFFADPYSQKSELLEVFAVYS